MKAKAWRKLRIASTAALALAAGACGNGAAESQVSGETLLTLMSSQSALQQNSADSRAKDPAWKPEFEEIGLIEVGKGGSPGALKNFCLNAEGNILACYAPAQAAGQRTDAAKPATGIRIYSPDGKLLETLPLDFGPEAICVAQDGSIFAAGSGRVVKLDATGKVLAAATYPGAATPVVITDGMMEMIKETGRAKEEEVKQLKGSLASRRMNVTGLAVTGEDVFMAAPAPDGSTYQVYRLDLALQNPKLVVDKLHGCCGQMDVQARDGTLWIPHNARHQVESHDRDGKLLAQFGTTGRVKASDFGGCCEPKNLRPLANGEILAAESGPPTCIKRFSAEGKFLGVVALVESKGDCVRVTVEASADGTRYYLLDTARDAIRIFGRKS